MLNSKLVGTLAGKIVILRPGEIVFNPHPSDRAGRRIEIDLTQISDDFNRDFPNYYATLKQQWNFARRNLIKESFEVASAYCRATQQEPAFHATKWYRFARIIRNCVSHDLHFRFKKKDLSALPVTYLNTTLDASLNGTPMLESHLDHYLAFSLFNEIESFVSHH